VHAGAVALSRTGNYSTGEFHGTAVLAQFGEVEIALQQMMRRLRKGLQKARCGVSSYIVRLLALAGAVSDRGPQVRPVKSQVFSIAI
jgi:hypothetical protein